MGSACCKDNPQQQFKKDLYRRGGSVTGGNKAISVYDKVAKSIDQNMRQANKKKGRGIRAAGKKRHEESDEDYNNYDQNYQNGYD